MTDLGRDPISRRSDAPVWEGTVRENFQEIDIEVRSVYRFRNETFKSEKLTPQRKVEGSQTSRSKAQKANL